jgi:hypothetical protein
MDFPEPDPKAGEGYWSVRAEGAFPDAIAFIVKPNRELIAASSFLANTTHSR